MAITLAGSAGVPQLGTQTSYVADWVALLGHTPAPGNLVVLELRRSTETPSDGPPDQDWDLVAAADAGSSTQRVEMWAREFDGTEPTTAGWTFPSSTRRVQVWEAHDSDDGTWSLDKVVQYVGATGNVTSRAPGSTGTLTSAAEFAVGVMALDGSTGGSEAIVGFTVNTGGPVTNQIGGHRITAATTALNPTFSWTTPRATLCGALVTFRRIPSVGITADLRWAVAEEVTTTADLRWAVEGPIVVATTADLRWDVESTSFPIPAIPSADLLDLAGVGVRKSCFRWEVLNAQHQVIGECHPVEESAPTIENNMNRTIKRDMRGFVLHPSEANAVNPLRDRIRPVMVLQNSAEYPMGVFLFVDGSRVPYTGGEVFTGSLLDQCWLLDQPIAHSISFGVGTDIRTALIAFLGDIVGISDVVVDDFTARIGNEPVVWPAGTSQAKIANGLCAKAGCFSVYFDNTGAGRVRIATDLTATPAVTYVDGGCDGTALGNILVGSTIVTDNLLDAPNQFIVIDSSARDAPITGLYNVPDAAPNSAFNRGEVIATVINEQGLESVEAANARAQAAAQAAASDFTWVSFQGVIDPRHDTFDVVSFRGEQYREQRWSVAVREGAAMAHDLRKVLAVTT